MMFLNFFLFSLALWGIYILQKRGVSLAKRIMIAFGFGILLGITFYLLYNNSKQILSNTLEWTNVIGTSYIRLLLMMVMPLISISLFSAILNLKVQENLLRNTLIIILFLIFGSFLGALSGIASSVLFNLNANDFQNLLNHGISIHHTLLDQTGNVKSLSLPSQIAEFIPLNPFADLAGLRQTSALGVVIFSLIAGSAALGLKLRKPEKYEPFTHMMNSLKSLVLRMTRIIIELTPYAIVSLITALISTQNIETLMTLINFVVASYVAIFTVFIIQLLILKLAHVNPLTYLKKSFSVLMFGFVSRNSAGTLPLTVETLKSLGVKERYASITASLGLSIGQAGCAGVYPAMLAMMVAPSLGIDPLNGYFLLKLIGIVLISSFGIAGVGGGATAAALMVLPMLGFPIVIVGVLMTVEPLIDMIRTSLNINNNLVTGILTSKIVGEFDYDTLMDQSIIIKE